MVNLHGFIIPIPIHGFINTLKISRSNPVEEKRYYFCSLPLFTFHNWSLAQKVWNSGWHGDHICMTEKFYYLLIRYDDMNALHACTLDFSAWSSTSNDIAKFNLVMCARYYLYWLILVKFWYLIQFARPFRLDPLNRSYIVGRNNYNYFNLGIHLVF